MLHAFSNLVILTFEFNMGLFVSNAFLSTMLGHCILFKRNERKYYKPDLQV